MSLQNQLCLLMMLALLSFAGKDVNAQVRSAKPGSQPNIIIVPEGPDVNLGGMVAQTVPTTMVAGGVYSVTLSFRNTGNTDWAPAFAYALGSQNPPDNTVWGGSRVPVVGGISPNRVANFTFNVTAPSVPGDYNFQWQMVQGDEWFGGKSTNLVVSVIPQAALNAAEISSVRFSPMTEGQVTNVSVTVENHGTRTWPAGSNYKLGSKNPDENTIWGVQRIDLLSDVAPGQSYTFTFPVTPPATGDYRMQWQMMERYVEWFGAISDTPVFVSSARFLRDTVTYIHTDALGSPVARTDSEGGIISRTSYEPYGRTAGGVTPTIGFTGHVNDSDTGLVYMQQRYYDPVAGRFLSVDPVVTDTSTGSSFNRYSYANNSPYKYSDPDGRLACADMGGNCHTVNFISPSGERGGGWKWQCTSKFVQ